MNTLVDKGFVFLCTAANDMDAAVLESMLRGFDVPVIKKRAEDGDLVAIYIGTSFRHSDIFVPAAQLEKAQEILAAAPCFDEMQEDDGDFLTESVLVKTAEKRRRTGWSLLLPLMFFVAVLIGMTIALLMQL